MRNFYDLYMKYKKKYINLKSTFFIQTGGNFNYEKIINDLSIYINQLINISKNNNSEKNIDELLKNINNYLIINDIPVNFNGDIYETHEDLLESLNKFKEELTINNLTNYYELRNYIYTINKENYNEILDSFILKMNLHNYKDIEKLIGTSLFGNNKNYILWFIILLKLAINNKTQITTIENNISFLTVSSIYKYLSESLNDDDFIEILILLIKEYIKSFPIKKTLLIKNPLEINNLININTEMFDKLNLIESYDTKNNVIIYKSGIIKDDKKANLDDIKQILNSLFRIPIFHQ